MFSVVLSLGSDLKCKRVIKHWSGWWFQTWFIFHFIYGMSSFPLTNSIIFQGGRSTRSTTNQWFFMVVPQQQNQGWPVDPVDPSTRLHRTLPRLELMKLCGDALQDAPWDCPRDRDFFGENQPGEAMIAKKNGHLMWTMIVDPMDSGGAIFSDNPEFEL